MNQAKQQRNVNVSNNMCFEPACVPTGTANVAYEYVWGYAICGREMASHAMPYDLSQKFKL